MKIADKYSITHTFNHVLPHESCRHVLRT